jgi:hypothetical protein
MKERALAVDCLLWLVRASCHRLVAPFSVVCCKSGGQVIVVITNVMRQTSTGYGNGDSELHVLLVVEAIARGSGLHLL